MVKRRGRRGTRGRRATRRMRGGDDVPADTLGQAPAVVPAEAPTKTLRERAAELPLIGRFFAPSPTGGRHTRRHRRR